MNSRTCHPPLCGGLEHKCIRSYQDSHPRSHWDKVHRRVLRFAVRTPPDDREYTNKRFSVKIAEVSLQIGTRVLSGHLVYTPRIVEGIYIAVIVRSHTQSDQVPHEVDVNPSGRIESIPGI